MTPVYTVLQERGDSPGAGPRLPGMMSLAATRVTALARRPAGQQPWTLRLSLVLAALLVYGLCGAATASRSTRDRIIALDALTLGVEADGAVQPVQDADLLVPGSRVLAGTSGTAFQLRAERDWLAAGTVPTVHGLGAGTLVRDALLDLRTLSLDTGVSVAGWSPAWRYVWPRDSALVAVALARTGHFAEAEAVLELLQQVQPASGVFDARYRPDGSVPDDRGEQLDGTGWALWALAGVIEAAPATEQRALLARYRVLLDRSTATARAAVTDDETLPPVSSDYWERRERRPTLATAALLRAGLEAAGRLYALAGDPAATAAAETSAATLGSAIRTRFAADGYPRHPGGPASSVDLGVVFLMPPFAARPDAGAVAAFRQAPRALLRPAGGLAPGGSWRDDGVSWTTATSSFALAAAALGDRDAALAWLRWLDAHRTAAGSLPEKVLADGRPAAVAPLGWPTAAVVLAAAELAEGGLADQAGARTAGG